MEEEIGLACVCKFDEEHQWNITYKNNNFSHTYLG